jgi:hypothetical protein
MRFLFERFDLTRKVAVCVHEPAQLHECTHDGDVDSRSPERSPVSQTDNAVHPTASQHVVFT